MTQITAFPLVSLDGRVNDKNGKIDWHTPDEEIHEFVNELHSRFSDHIYDEGTYEIMKYWENPPNLDSMPQVFQQYAHLWQQTGKTVISTHLSGLNPEHYTVWPELTADALSGLKQSASGDIMLGGAQLITKALDLRLLDRIYLLTVPVILGGGDPLFRETLRTELKLMETRTFSKGWVFSSYETL